MSYLQQNWRTRERNSFCPEAGEGRELAQTMYTHVSKCKNNKIKINKKDTMEFLVIKTVSKLA
jgi:hypothetical protein